MRRLLVSVALLIVLALVGGNVHAASYEVYLPLALRAPALQLAAAVPSQNVNAQTCATIQELGQSKVPILRTWDLQPPICDGITSWAEIYGPGQVGDPAGGNVAEMLTFNEWDLWGDYAASLSQSVDAYHQAVLAYPTRVLFAPSALKADHIRDWLDLYEQRYDAQPPGLDLHIYCEFGELSANEQMAANQLAVTAQLARDRAGGRMVLSEFGCNPIWFQSDKDAQSQAFMAYVIDESRRYPEIEWLGWFSWQMSCTESWWPHPDGCTTLVTMAGQPTSYLSAYLATYTQALSGDVNGDGCVDILDLVTIGRQFGQCQ